METPDFIVNAPAKGRKIEVEAGKANNEEVCMLIEKLRNGRGISELSRDTGISTSLLSKIITRNNVRLTTDTMRKLTDPSANPNGITFEDLVDAMNMSPTYLSRKEQDEKYMSNLRKIVRSELFRVLLDAFPDYEELPKSYIDRPRKISYEWSVNPHEYYCTEWSFILLPNFDRVSNQRCKDKFKDIISELVMLTPDPGRKITFITDNEIYYPVFREFKETNCYNGELSYISVSNACRKFTGEEYIAHYCGEDKIVPFTVLQFK